MPCIIDDACDLLRGRVRRIAGRDGARRLRALAPTMGISGRTLLTFMNDTANPTIETLRLIERWCNTQDDERDHHE